MATIVDAKNLTTDLVSGVIESSEVATPNNVRIKFVVSNTTSESMYFLATYLVDAAPLRDKDHELQHRIVGNDTSSINLLAVNAAALVVVLTPVGVHDGDITVTTVES